MDRAAALLLRAACSSRAIDRAPVEDDGHRVIAAHQRPDHATSARFIERHEPALAHLFGEVLSGRRLQPTPRIRRV
jgi:hypothetical protein